MLFQNIYIVEESLFRRVYKITPMPIPPYLKPQNVQPIHKRRVVIHILHQIHPIPGHHIHAPHSIQVINIDIMAQAIALNAEDARLTDALGRDVRARGVVVVEEGVETDAVAVDRGAAQDAEGPAFRVGYGGRSGIVGGHGAVPGWRGVGGEGGSVRCKDRIKTSGVFWEGERGVGVGLVVSRLRSEGGSWSSSMGTYAVSV
jgi:hypothetical protein